MHNIDTLIDRLRGYDHNLGVLAEAGDRMEHGDLAMFFRSLLAMNESAIGTGMEAFILAALVANGMVALHLRGEDREFAKIIERVTGLPGPFRAEEN